MKTRHMALLILLAAGLTALPCALDFPSPVLAADPGVNSGDASSPERSAADFAARAGRSLEAGLNLEALGLADDGLDVDPAYMPLMRIKVLALIRLERHEEADAALQLALAAEPGDREINLQAVRNDMALFQNDPARLAERLTGRFTAMSPETRPPFVAELFADARALAARDHLLRGLINSGALSDGEKAIASSLFNGQAKRAAELVRSASGAVKPGEQQAPLIAAFAFLAGRLLPLSETGETAETMLETAERLGFDRPAIQDALAGKYLEAGQPRRAGEVYAGFWRQSTAPNRVAAQAAEAFLLAGDQAAAIRILEDALTASPHEAFLQGLYLSTLLESGRTDRAKAYEQTLERHGGRIGLHYGRYLYARAAGRLPEANAELVQIYRDIGELTQRHTHESVDAILEATDYFTGITDQPFIVHMNEGWRAWNEGHDALALENWEKAFSINPGLAERFAPRVVNTLFLNEMTDSAMRLLRKYAPTISPASFSVSLMLERQWHVLQPVLAAAPLPSTLESWQNLALAQAAAFMGDDAAARRYANAWLASPPSPERLSTRMYVATGGPAGGGLQEHAFTRREHQALVADFIQTLGSRGLTDILADVARSGRLKTLPPHLRAYVQGRMSLMEGDFDAAARYFNDYLQVLPADETANPDVLYELFRIYLDAKSYTTARVIRDRLAALTADHASELTLDEVPPLLYLAEAESGLGRFDQAEGILRGVLRSFPDHSGAATDLVLVLRLLGRLEEADRLVAASGQPDPDQPYYLRRMTEKSLERGYPEKAEAYAAKSLAAYPYSGYMHNLYLMSLLEQGKVAALDAHANTILEGNPINSPALRALLEKTTALNDQEATALVARRMVEAYPYDPADILQDAMQSVNEGSMKHTYEAVEKVAAPGINGSASVWAFPELSRTGEGNAVTIADIDYLLTKTAATNTTVSISDVFSYAATAGREDDRVVDRIPTVLLVSGMAESDLRQVDALLARHQARAALVVTDDSFIPNGPDNLPSQGYLNKLAATGRWEFVLSDVRRRTIFKDAAGNPVSFWDGPAWVGGRTETPEEMRLRLSAALKHIKRQAAAAGFPIDVWAYPQGDYGQSKINFSPEYTAAYDAAVREHFAKSFVATPTGYHLAGADHTRLPVRTFYTRPRSEDIRNLGYNHPSRQAVLDEGAIAGWHGQIPRGQMLLERAEAAELGLRPQDLTYYRAANTYYGEDVPQTARRARKAVALDPEAARTTSLLRQVEKDKRPVLSAGFRDWWDDDDRGYLEDWLTFTDYVTEELSLYGTTSLLNWDSNGDSSRGQALGGGLRYHVFDDHWVDAHLRAVRVNGADSFAEWGLGWRGVVSTDFLGFNGIYQLQYNRETMETMESIEEGIYADRISLDGVFRFLNWGILEANTYTTLRTDGNRTVGLSLHPAYIVWDKPRVRLGYRMDMATSDENPEEYYYAPQGYQAHLATFRIEHQLTPWLRLDALAEYGLGTSLNTDGWSNILRYGGDASVVITDWLSMDLGYRKLQLPDYESDQVTGGLSWIF